MLYRALVVLTLLAGVQALPMEPRQLTAATASNSSHVKSIGSKTQKATGVKVATGLPGITPAKKAVASVTSVSPATYTLFRSQLQDAICPSATEEEKETLECKSYAIRMDLKKASMLSEEEKSVLLKRRVDLFQSAGKKSAEDVLQAKVKSISLYQKAFAKFCTSSKSKEEGSLCTNSLMIKTYGPDSKLPTAKPTAAKPAKAKPATTTAVA